MDDLVSIVEGDLPLAGNFREHLEGLFGSGLSFGERECPVRSERVCTVKQRVIVHGEVVGVYEVSSSSFDDDSSRIYDGVIPGYNNNEPVKLVWNNGSEDPSEDEDYDFTRRDPHIEIPFP